MLTRDIHVVVVIYAFSHYSLRFGVDRNRTDATGLLKQWRLLRHWAILFAYDKSTGPQIKRTIKCTHGNLSSAQSLWTDTALICSIRIVILRHNGMPTARVYTKDNFFFHAWVSSKFRREAVWSFLNLSFKLGLAFLNIIVFVFSRILVIKF